MSMKPLSNRIIEWIKNVVSDSGADGIVLGLSGGVDSATVGALCKRAVGEKLLSLIMPCHSEQCDMADSEKVAETFGIKTERVDLTSVYDQLTSILPSSSELADANLKPRLRMIVLYHYANRLNYLVAGTGNKTELEIGYFTKYGDGGVDMLPMAGLLKKEVRLLAAELGVPDEIISKPPTAGLWEGQTDEGEIGMSYEELDAVISSIHSRGTEKLEQASVARVRKLMEFSRHKRRPIPIFIP